jgi:SAM-dependent methyltransferase
MKGDIDRRTFLKLSTWFAVTWATGRALAMDGSPAPLKPSPDGVGGEQNLHAVQGASNFKAIYGDPEMRAAFLLFLRNVYHIYPEQKFHDLIGDTASSGATDRAIYLAAQQRLPSIKPFLADLTYALPALSKQKAEMARQAHELLRSRTVIDGYMEIGTTGRYVAGLGKRIALRGDVVLLHTDAPRFSPTDVVERGGLARVGRFVALGDYAPVPKADVPDAHLDVVSNFIGFHHSPLDRLDGFVRSLHRVLRPGGTLIVRDHDVDSPRMNRFVALAHDVFNMGLGAPWPANQSELRHFTSLAQLTTYLEDRGFRRDPRALYQEGDPTRNALIAFTRT